MLKPTAPGVKASVTHQNASQLKMLNLCHLTIHALKSMMFSVMTKNIARRLAHKILAMLTTNALGARALLLPLNAILSKVPELFHQLSSNVIKLMRRSKPKTHANTLLRITAMLRMSAPGARVNPFHQAAILLRWQGIFLLLILTVTTSLRSFLTELI